MKSIGRRLLSSGCVLALVANSVAGALAQDRRSDASNAQALYGSIAGNVKDISNAVIPGATVRITHKETNQTRETAASPIGSFNFPTVQTGTYEITVRSPGFKTYTRSGVEVMLNNITRSDITLDVGGVSETIWITVRSEERRVG